MRFHWQNLNDKKDGTTGSGLRNGRCWLHFGDYGPNDRSVRLEWNLWSLHCGIGAEITDEDLTFFVGFPPIAIWLSFSPRWWLIRKIAPKFNLSERYGLEPRPGDIEVIDEREVGIRIHSGKVWINPWSRLHEWRSNDPWWIRGITFSINPFEWTHQQHDVYATTGRFEPFVGSWEVGRDGKEPDRRKTWTAPYRYVRRSGEIQETVATVYIERMTWRPRCLQWTDWFERKRISIDVAFKDEIGERIDSWKGGTIGCSWELQRGEHPLSALRRMEKERKFD
jgi:hypothetical protein